MSKNVEFTTNFDSFDTFKLFKKEVREQIIENGLDASLSLSAKELKSDLQYVVNKKITTTSSQGITNSNSSNQAVNDLNQPSVSIPKSEDELIKFLTNGKSDPSKYNKAKDYTSLNESNIVFGHSNRGTGPSNRITLRMEINPGETVEEQYQKATKFFQESLFALPGSNGTDYFINPGIDISKFVKIKCSTQTGYGDQKTKKGLNPSERFDKTQQKGYAEWTIKQEAVDMIRKNYINITDVMNFLKVGDIDRASELVDRLNKNQTLTTVKEQITKLKTGVGVPATTQSYTNAVKLINNLKIIKKITPEDVVYSLVSSFDDFQNTEVDFYEYIQNAIRSWGVDHEDYWFNSLVKKVEKLIKQYESA